MQSFIFFIQHIALRIIVCLSFEERHPSSSKGSANSFLWRVEASLTSCGISSTMRWCNKRKIIIIRCSFTNLMCFSFPLSRLLFHFTTSIVDDDDVVFPASNFTFILDISYNTHFDVPWNLQVRSCVINQISDPHKLDFCSWKWNVKEEELHKNTTRY